MTMRFTKKTVIFLMLGLLTASAFFMRLQNVRGSTVLSIDEVVYYRMAMQILRDGPAGYHTVPYARELAADGRDLPGYFFQPLFKHPPLFTFLLAASMYFFGKSLLVATYVPLLMGALLIPLTYWIAVLLFDRKVALCASFFLWMDPVTIMTSQKIWMDSTIAFFMLSAFLLFILGVNQDRDEWFIAGGILAGLAMLTKYTAVFVVVATALFVYVYRRELYRRPSFILSLAVPFLMLIPWVYWNVQVYGNKFLVLQQKMHMNEHIYSVLIALLILLGAAVGLLRFLCRKKNPVPEREELPPGSPGLFTRTTVDFVLGGLLFIFLAGNIALSLRFGHVPRTSWESNVFWYAPVTFYAGQLIEYSLVYVFAFASFFIERKDRLAEISLLRYQALVSLLFFTLWKSFQCRYILFAIPLLSILAFEFIFLLYSRLDRMRPFLPKVVLKGCFIMFLFYSLNQTMMINLQLSFTNDMCYF